MKSKTIQSAAKIISLTAALTLLFSACSEQSPFSPSQSNTSSSLAKRGRSGSDDSLFNESNSLSQYAQGNYPQSFSVTLCYRNGRQYYSGGSINMPNGSNFQVVEGSLTPPEGTPVGEDVTITMLIERDEVNNELVFSFGPSGSAFAPPAEVWLSWSDLGPPNAKLYYIDQNGNYIQQEPSEIDLQGRRLKIYIYHPLCAL